jgi:Fe-S cluster assembly protein SufD
MSVQTRNDYLERLLSGHDGIPEAASGWLKALRAAAVERANALAVPTTRDEDWRFTDLAPLYKSSYRPASEPGVVTAAGIAQLEIPEAASRLVFVDGRHVPALSSNAATNGVTVCNLADPAANSLAEGRLGSAASFECDAFAAVNTAFLHDGAVVHVAAGRSLQAPIHLLFIATRRDCASYPRILVVAETGSECTVVEDYVGVADGGYLTDSVAEIFVEENAAVSHVKLQHETATAFHIANTSVRVARSGRYRNWSVEFGARISRHNLGVVQAGEGTEFHIEGLALISGRQLADTSSVVDHAFPHGRSRQLHKTIVGGGAHAVFNGKIFVRQGAQQTDSGQQSRNLLLSDKAHVDTKPQLEIFADDVKCAHGATVGQIADDEIFYLMSRGLSDVAARSLLTYAFAAEIVERIPVKSLVTRIERVVMEQTQMKETA